MQAMEKTKYLEPSFSSLVRPLISYACKKFKISLGKEDEIIQSEFDMSELRE